MIQIGYSIVSIATGAEIAFGTALPISPPPPDNPNGRIATFDAVGQEADGYRCVERWTTQREHAYQVSAGTSISLVDGKTVVDLQWTDRPLADVKAARHLEIKAAANARILALTNSSSNEQHSQKSDNAIARQAELGRIIAGTMRDENGDFIAARALTPEEDAEDRAIAALWRAIKAIRAHSNSLEAQVTALGTVADVVAFEIVGWPA